MSLPGLCWCYGADADAGVFCLTAMYPVVVLRQQRRALAAFIVRGGFFRFPARPAP